MTNEGYHEPIEELLIKSSRIISSRRSQSHTN